MSAKANNLKIGIFAILAVLLLVAGLLAFGAKSYFAPKTMFETAVEDDVSGLSVGSGVELRGVPIGKVTSITFSWHAYPKTKSHMIVVEFEIEGDLMPWPPGDLKTLIKHATDNGLRAVVKGQGITGTSILSLDLSSLPFPEPPPLDYTPRYYYIPSTPGQFTRMLDSIEKSLVNIQKLDFGNIGEGVTNVLESVRQLTDKLGKMDLDQIGTNANSLVVDLRATTAKLNDAVGQVQETLKGMKLDTVSTNANGLIAGLRETNAKLQTVLDKVGAAPMQDTIGNLQQALQTLSDVLLELKQYPSGFIFGQPPPPAKGVQPPPK